MCKEIPLSRGKVALISDCDYARVAAYKWSLDANGYACRMERTPQPNGQVVQRKVLLHRFILDCPAGLEVDHANRELLDCRRDNLRLATRAQNNANRPSRPGSASRYKGVFPARPGRWRAEITVAGRRRWLGQFQDEQDAARAYDRAAHAAWGDYAFLNFPHEFRSESSSVSS